LTLRSKRYGCSSYIDQNLHISYFYSKIIRFTGVISLTDRQNGLLSMKITDIFSLSQYVRNFNLLTTYECSID